MRLLPMLFLSAALALPGAPALADARLDTRLALSVDQARQVNEVEARYRRVWASARQEFNRESRALRRARLANDGAEIARLEGVTGAMESDLIRTRAEWDDAIRALLTPSQMLEFEQHVRERKEMVGRRTDATY
jgi:Spy/CpxP family protein refolding chaperone